MYTIFPLFPRVKASQETNRFKSNRGRRWGKYVIILIVKSATHELMHL